MSVRTIAVGAGASSGEMLPERDMISQSTSAVTAIARDTSHEGVSRGSTWRSDIVALKSDVDCHAAKIRRARGATKILKPVPLQAVSVFSHELNVPRLIRINLAT